MSNKEAAIELIQILVSLGPEDVGYSEYEAVALAIRALSKGRRWTQDRDRWTHYEA